MVLGRVFKFDSVSLSQLNAFCFLFLLFFFSFFLGGGGGGFGLRRGVMVGTCVFLACHQCYCAGLSLAWGLNLRALVFGIFSSLLPGGFLLPSPDSAFDSHGHLFSHSSWKRCSLALVCFSIKSVVSSSFPSSFFFL